MGEKLDRTSEVDQKAKAKGALVSRWAVDSMVQMMVAQGTDNALRYRCGCGGG